MARLGDLIKSQRTKYGMTPKQLARKCGVSEGFILEIESGKRIPNDVVATQLLKAMGSTDPLMDLSAGSEREPEPAPRPIPKKQPEKAAPIPAGEISDVWKDALGGLVKQVPVLDLSGKRTGSRMLATQDNKIEGAAPEKVFYLRQESDELRFYRIMKGDLLLCAPHPGLIDGAVMAFTLDGARMLRMVRKMEGDKADLFWFDGREQRQSVKISQMKDFAKILRVEFTP